MVSAVSSGGAFPVQTRQQHASEEVDFLRLLTVQLQHQDPFNPVDEREFLSQLAQFAALNELSSIRQVLEPPGWQAATLVGRQVTVLTDAGPVSGQVSSVVLWEEPMVTIDQWAYPVSSIVEVREHRG